MVAEIHPYRSFSGSHGDDRVTNEKTIVATITNYIMRQIVVAIEIHRIQIFVLKVE